MKKLDIQKVFSFLGLILRCPICSERYQLNQVEVIESEEDEFMQESKVLVHSDCAKCKSSVIFNIDISGPDVFSVGMVTDLTSQDSIKFKDMNPISAEECIYMHQGLQESNDGFFKALTQKPKKAKPLK